MSEKALLISENKQDRKDIAGLLGEIESLKLTTHGFEGIESLLFEDDFCVILLDYGASKERITKWHNLLQERNSRACFIVYGDHIEIDDLLEIMQDGIFTFIKKDLLPQKIDEAIKKGLENRNAFVEILGMIDELKEVNDKLKKEKEIFRKKNEELNFINRISSEVAYDTSCGNFLLRLLTAGLDDVIEYKLFSILFWLGSQPHLSIHIPAGIVKKYSLKNIKNDIAARFMNFSQQNLNVEEIIVECRVSENGKLPLTPFNPPLEKALSIPLRIEGMSLGMIYAIPKGRRNFHPSKTDLLLTLSNILAFSLKNAQEYQRAKEMAITDGLTGAYNQRAFFEFIKKELRKAIRYKKPLSLIMIDVDKFKEINDRHGHLVGDHVLRELSFCLSRSVRDSDIIARYGGDEFAIILPDTGKVEAETVIGRILKTIENHRFSGNGSNISINITYGISNLEETEKNESVDNFINRADSRLYLSKNSRKSPVYQMVS